MYIYICIYIVNVKPRRQCSHHYRRNILNRASCNSFPNYLHNTICYILYVVDQSKVSDT